MSGITHSFFLSVILACTCFEAAMITILRFAGSLDRANLKPSPRRCGCAGAISRSQTRRWHSRVACASSLARELCTLVEIDMTPAQAVRAATIDAGELLGWKVGRIQRLLNSQFECLVPRLVHTCQMKPDKSRRR